MSVEEQVMSQDYRTGLLEILYARSFMYDPENGFLLASGKRSDVYIDVRKTALSAEGMELIGYTLYQELKLEPIDAIGGLTMGADPISIATALVSTMNNRLLDAFVVRKEAKKHGTQQWIEGNLRKDAWVAVVDDVVTTGESIITAIERVREAGYNVRKVLALVDREEGGAENILAKTKCKLVSIFTKSELLEFHAKIIKEKESPPKPKPQDMPKGSW
jgi:orotate phosphoribosyltransferase